MRERVGSVGFGALFLIVAIVLFILAGLGVKVSDASEVRLVAWGLAAFAAAFLIP